MLERHRIIVAAVLLAGLTATAPARAQDWDQEGGAAPAPADAAWEGDPEQGGQGVLPLYPTRMFEADLGIYSPVDVSVTNLSLRLSGRYEVVDGFVLEMVLPTAFSLGEDQTVFGTRFDPDGAALGDLFLGGYFWTQQDILTVEAGIGVALPTYADSDQPGGGVASLFAANSYALWDLWLWLDDTITPTARGRLEVDPIPEFVAAAEIDMGLFIPIDERDGDTELGLQFAAEGAYRIDPMSVVGLRFQGFWLTTESDGDNFQSAMGPFFRYGFGEPEGGGYVRAALLMALDDELGFAFDDFGAWRLSLAGGALF